MQRTVIATSHAPAAIGPYSQAVNTGTGLIYTAGQVALDPATGQLVGTTVGEQTRRALENIRAILEAGGSGLERIVKTTVFLKNMNDFTAMNEVYRSFFTDLPPARSTVEVARLPKDALVEIEAVALTANR